MNTTATSIQTAIEHNLAVQREVVRHLMIVVQQKVKNREMAQKLMEAYRMCQIKIEQDATPPPIHLDETFYSNLAKEMRKRHQRQNQQSATKAKVVAQQDTTRCCLDNVAPSADEGIAAVRQQQQMCGSYPSDDDDAAAAALTTKAGSLPVIKPAKKTLKTTLTVKQLKQAFQQDRKWNLHYFIDPLGSVPEPNEDTKFRHSILEGACDGTTRIFPFHGDISLYSWSKEEIQCLEQAVEEIRQQQQQHAKTLESSSSSSVPAKTHSNNHCCSSASLSSAASSSSSSQSCSGSISIIDSQIDFLAVAKLFNSRSKAKIVKWGTTRYSVAVPRTDVECRNKYLYSVSSKINKGPWTKDESMKLLELVHSYRQDHDDHPPWDEVAIRMKTNRTPWQCFTHYRQDLNTSLKSLPWTANSDELLFKYVSSQGPRFLLNNTTATNICRDILPNRNPKQILARCTRTLLNPNFVHEPWSEDEERKLVVLMKVYRDCTNPIGRAALHFPHRATKLVWDKWQRSLNPEFSTRPWTKAEDEALLAAVERYEGGWISSSAEISEEFPLRRTKQLYNRWLELIDEKCLVHHRHASLKNKAASNKGNLLDPNDFVVRVKRKRCPDDG